MEQVILAFIRNNQLFLCLVFAVVFRRTKELLFLLVWVRRKFAVRARNSCLSNGKINWTNRKRQFRGQNTRSEPIAARELTSSQQEIFLVSIRQFADGQLTSSCNASSKGRQFCKALLLTRTASPSLKSHATNGAKCCVKGELYVAQLLIYCNGIRTVKQLHWETPRSLLIVSQALADWQTAQAHLIDIYSYWNESRMRASVSLKAINIIRTERQIGDNFGCEKLHQRLRRRCLRISGCSLVLNCTELCYIRKQSSTDGISSRQSAGLWPLRLQVAENSSIIL